MGQQNFRLKNGSWKLVQSSMTHLCIAPFCWNISLWLWTFYVSAVTWSNTILYFSEIEQSAAELLSKLWDEWAIFYPSQTEEQSCPTGSLCVCFNFPVCCSILKSESGPKMGSTSEAPRFLLFNPCKIWGMDGRNIRVYSVQDGTSHIILMERLWAVWEISVWRFKKEHE